jgi:8-oxo-dGTP pyrophosphatase MutT (NUDIX family)
MISKNTPKNWEPKHIVASSFVIHNGKLLFLKRHPDKIEGTKWGLPTGKVEENEDLLEGMKRELFEETGIKAGIEKFQYITTYYVDHPYYKFNYNLYLLKLNTRPNIKLHEGEHTDYTWMSPQKALDNKLFKDTDIVLRDYFHI